jgi:hypothetical protein
MKINANVYLTGAFILDRNDVANPIGLPTRWNKISLKELIHLLLDVIVDIRVEPSRRLFVWPKPIFNQKLMLN